VPSQSARPIILLGVGVGSFILLALVAVIAINSPRPVWIADLKENAQGKPAENVVALSGEKKTEMMPVENPPAKTPPQENEKTEANPAVKSEKKPDEKTPEIGKPKQQEVKKEKVKTDPTLGMTPEQVSSILGEPDFMEGYKGETLWTYGTKVIRFRDGQVTAISTKQPEDGWWTKWNEDIQKKQKEWLVKKPDPPVQGKMEAQEKPQPQENMEIGRKLEVRIRRAKANDPSDIFFPDVAGMNGAIVVSAQATDKALVLNLKIIGNMRGSPYAQLLVRLFDENGQYLTHFTTRERFSVEANRNYRLAYPVNRRDLRDAAILEICFILPPNPLDLAPRP
jgi:outer membrane biosynthesis protein TonB